MKTLLYTIRRLVVTSGTSKAKLGYTRSVKSAPIASSLAGCHGNQFLNADTVLSRNCSQPLNANLGATCAESVYYTTINMVISGGQD